MCRPKEKFEIIFVFEIRPFIIWVIQSLYTYIFWIYTTFGTYCIVRTATQYKRLTK